MIDTCVVVDDAACDVAYVIVDVGVLLLVVLLFILVLPLVLLGLLIYDPLSCYVVVVVPIYAACSYHVVG